MPSCPPLSTTWFQIPMRGNELDRGAERLAADLVPIPMRGNEDVAAGHQRAPPAWFQIPMRGNERWPISSSADWRIVPNPHEG